MPGYDKRWRKGLSLIRIFEIILICSEHFLILQNLAPNLCKIYAGSNQKTQLGFLAKISQGIRFNGK